MSRTLIRVTGADRHDFLQGLVTNDVTKLDQGLVYAALLTPQGKYLADFFLKEDGDAILLDVADSLGASLMQRLSMYKLRADVALEESPLKVARGTGPAPEGALPDPRHDALGWRLYGEAGGDDGTDWDALRVAHCVPESGIELGPDSFILEMGFERLNGVDFRKGCYVGQEIAARMKHKTALRKGLARVRVLSGAAGPGTEISAGGKAAGVLHTQSGDGALAYLRFDRLTEEMTAGDAVLAPLDRALPEVA